MDIIRQNDTHEQQREMYHPARLFLFLFFIQEPAHPIADQKDRDTRKGTEQHLSARIKTDDAQDRRDHGSQQSKLPFDACFLKQLVIQRRQEIQNEQRRQEPVKVFGTVGNRAAKVVDTENRQKLVHKGNVGFIKSVPTDGNDQISGQNTHRAFFVKLADAFGFAHRKVQTQSRNHQEHIHAVKTDPVKDFGYFIGAGICGVKPHDPHHCRTHDVRAVFTE